MSSIFIGKAGLRLKYSKLTHVSMMPADSVNNAAMLATLMGSSRIGYFDNSLNCDVAILACHPLADPSDPQNRLLMFELPAGRFLNFDQNIPGAEFDAGTYLLAHWVDVAPTAGTLRLVWWG